MDKALILMRILLFTLIYLQSSQLRGQEVLTTEFDLTSSSKFTPFYFSPVKSFHQDSIECLSV